jgi:hypothetical protein
LRELGELMPGEVIDAVAEEPEARQRAEALEPGRQVGDVLGLDRPDDDLRAVGQGHALAAQRRSGLAGEVPIVQVPAWTSCDTWRAAAISSSRARS